MPSSELFSYRGHDAAMPIAGDKQWPFNFGDLAPNPVPWDAWINQETCVDNPWSSQCQTITQAAYRPGIVYPRAFWSMEPEWSKCGSGPMGIVDPPTALPTAHGVALPTMPNVVSTQTTAASPKMDPTSNLVKPTADPPRPNPHTLKSTKGSSTEAAHHSDPPASNSVERGSTKTGGDPASSPSDPSREGSIYTTISGTHANGPTSRQPPSFSQSSSAKLTSSVQDPTTILVPTSAIGHSPVSLGTLAIVSASEAGAVSIGTHLLSVGQATTLGATVISLGSQTLVASVIPSAASPGTSSDNALSVLEGGQTQEPHPLVKVTLDGQTFTAYSGGMVAGAGTTMLASQSKVVDVHGQTISFASDGVVVASSSYNFQVYSSVERTQDTGTPGRSSSIVDPTLAITYAHATSETTMYGHLDLAGNTVMYIGSSTFTYSNQAVTEGGVTFTPLSDTKYAASTASGARTSRHSNLETKLPSIQSTRVIITSAPSSTASDSSTLGNEHTSTSSKSDATLIHSSFALPYITAILFMLLVGF